MKPANECANLFIFARKEEKYNKLDQG